MSIVRVINVDINLLVPVYIRWHGGLSIYKILYIYKNLYKTYFCIFMGEEPRSRGTNEE